MPLLGLPVGIVQDNLESGTFFWYVLWPILIGKCRELIQIQKFVFLNTSIVYIKSNLLKQIYRTKSTKLILPSKYLKYKEPNILNRIYQTMSIQSNLQYLIHPTNSTEPNLQKSNLQKTKVDSNSSLSWDWPSSIQACLLIFPVIFTNCIIID